MDKDFVYGSLIWGAVIAIVTWAIVFGCVTAGRFDHEFDKACISSGQSLRWESVQGDQYSHKVCR